MSTKVYVNNRWVETDFYVRKNGQYVVGGRLMPQPAVPPVEVPVSRWPTAETTGVPFDEIKNLKVVNGLYSVNSASDYTSPGKVEGIYATGGFVDNLGGTTFNMCQSGFRFYGNRSVFNHCGVGNPKWIESIQQQGYPDVFAGITNTDHGFQGSFDAFRCRVWGISDGFLPVGANGGSIVECYTNDHFGYVKKGKAISTYAHADGIQTGYARNWQVKGNALNPFGWRNENTVTQQGGWPPDRWSRTATSFIIMKPFILEARGLGGLSCGIVNFTIEDNLIGPFGGYTMYSTRGGYDSVTANAAPFYDDRAIWANNTIIRRNLFRRDFPTYNWDTKSYTTSFRPYGGQFGLLEYAEANQVHWGEGVGNENRWADTLEVIPFSTDRNQGLFHRFGSQISLDPSTPLNNPAPYNTVGAFPGGIPQPF